MVKFSVYVVNDGGTAKDQTPRQTMLGAISTTRDVVKEVSDSVPEQEAQHETTID